MENANLALECPRTIGHYCDAKVDTACSASLVATNAAAHMMVRRILATWGLVGVWVLQTVTFQVHKVDVRWFGLLQAWIRERLPPHGLAGSGISCACFNPEVHPLPTHARTES